MTVLGAVGLAATAWTPGAEEELPVEAGPTQRAEPTSRAEPVSGPSPSTSGPAVTPGTPASPGPAPLPSKIALPESGPGTFTRASGGSAKVGTGRTLRYRVDVEKGLELSATDVAEEVERILGDPRGWTADRRSAFQRVSGGATDFVVKVATPETVDKICGQYGLETRGEVNCSVDENVMVNLKRWVLATPVYEKDVTAYRALIINHEVGHFLGHGHVGCPGRGKPAPAMMQQIKGLKGCVPNVWPYDAKGRLVTGPAVP